MSPQLRDLWSAFVWNLFGYDVSRVSAVTVKKVFVTRFAAKGVRENALIVFFDPVPTVPISHLRANKEVHMMGPRGTYG